MAATRRKVLVPLATLMVAGSVAVGSGASFTSTTASTAAVTSGNVTHANDVTTLNIEDIKDDDTIVGSVTITNTGNIDSTLTLDSTTATGTFIDSDLNLLLESNGVVLYNASFDDVDDAALPGLGALPVGGSITVDFTVTLNETDDNTNEGKSAQASFTWVSTQVEGERLSFFDNLDLGPFPGN